MADSMRPDASIKRAAAPLAVTQGEPSGIGPEIAIKAWLSRGPNTPPWFLLADPDHMARTAAALGLDVPMAQVTPEQAVGSFAAALPVVPLKAKVIGAPGRPDPHDAPATLESIERAVMLVRSGQASALVTNPIAKDVLYKAGFHHPGHTEWLGELAEREWKTGPLRPVMLIWSELLAVVPVTIHLALTRAIAELTTQAIVETARITAHDYRTRFGVASPRLAIAGLNPHAGENGTMGREDIEIVAPAVVQLQAQGIDARGPLPPDTMFHAAARARYDVAICMYHDQGLIPAKTLAFDSGVNTTLGLPFIRTSPDHGAAFDIAGKGIANESSLIAAIALAARLVASATQ
jgi:4-hydroxythreonine-4-phosphate dehydrogenase